jgi:RNA polymerase sigma factor (sigma-70 family)
MVEFKVQKSYRDAIKRWAGVLWPVDRFGKHVEQTRLEGVEPIHMEDLYLAGAAGYRYDTAWEVIQLDLSCNVKKIVSTLPLADMTPDEVWSEMIEKLIDNDKDKPVLEDGRFPAKIIRYHGLVKLVNYFITISRRIAIQRNRKKRPDFFLSAVENSAGVLPAKSVSAQTQLVTEETVRILMDGLGSAFKKLSPEQRFLITMVFRNGMRQKEAGKMLGWSEFKTSRQIKKAVEMMKKEFTETEDIDWSPAAEKAFAGLWAGPWSQADVCVK